MTDDELTAKFAEFQQRLDALQKRIDDLQLQIDNRTAFNNSLAFNLNRVMHELKRLQERGESKSAG